MPVTKIKAISRIVAVFLLLLNIYPTSGQQSEQVTPAGTRFFLYAPLSYAKGGPAHPVLVSLHGLGSVGNDLGELLTDRDEIPAKLIHENRWPSDYPFIVVTPQLSEGITHPENQPGWPPTLVNELINFVVSTQTIDIDRIYLTGLSMGARGTWDFAATYPSRIAAMVPIAGLTDTLTACQLKNIPIWVFQGSNDGVVEPSNSINMVNAITRCQPSGTYTPHLTLLHAQKHEGWSGVYNNSSGYDVYNWLLNFSRNNNSNKPPYVNAGAHVKIAKREQPLHLYGEYFDSDGTIANVKWRQVSGSPVIMAGANTRFLKIVDPPIGAFEFELTVTDNMGEQKADQVKVEITTTPGIEPAVTDIVLLTGNNETERGKLSDGSWINTTALGTNRINLRAETAGDPHRVRFSVNDNQHLSTVIAPAPFVLMDQGWTATEGEYLICASPYAEQNGEASAGIAQCFKITVSKDAEPSVVTNIAEQYDAVQVYPNPTADEIQVTVAVSGNTRFLILNSLGIEARRGEISMAALAQGYKLDVASYPDGMYFLILHNRDLNLQARFIIRK